MGDDLLLRNRPDSAKAPGLDRDAAIHMLWMPSRERSVPAARCFLRRVLRERGLVDQSDTAELLLSELVTNAVLHGCADGPHVGIHVVVTCTQQQLKIAVGDEGRRMPCRRQVTPDDEDGRGMFLLEQLALSWGADAASRGKVVWFCLALNDR